jgi:uncharacterized protein (TIGR02246 family)
MAHHDSNTAVGDAANALIAATLRGDAEGVIACYLPSAPIVDQGVITPRFEAIVDGLREFYATHRVTMNELHDVGVMALAPDAAVLTAHYRFAAIGDGDQQITSAGAWTAVYMRVDGAWKIAAAHQSNPAYESG